MKCNSADSKCFFYCFRTHQSWHEGERLGSLLRKSILWTETICFIGGKGVKAKAQMISLFCKRKLMIITRGEVESILENHSDVWLQNAWNFSVNIIWKMQRCIFFPWENEHCTNRCCYTTVSLTQALHLLVYWPSYWRRKMPHDYHNKRY